MPHLKELSLQDVSVLHCLCHTHVTREAPQCHAHDPTDQHFALLSTCMATLAANVVATAGLVSAATFESNKAEVNAKHG